MKKTILIMTFALASTLILASALTSCGGEKQIRLNVFVTVHQGAADEVLAGLNAVAAESQKENGCLGYDIFRNTTKPDEVIIVETWANQAALDAHQLTTHYTTILPPLRDKMTMTLERFEFTPKK